MRCHNPDYRSRNGLALCSVVMATDICDRRHCPVDISASRCTQREKEFQTAANLRAVSTPESQSWPHVNPLKGNGNYTSHFLQQSVTTHFAFMDFVTTVSVNSGYFLKRR
jgi:hypothetical protein